MVTDAEIIEAVTEARGCRKHAAEALGICVKVLRDRISQIGPEKLLPPWKNGPSTRTKRPKSLSAETVRAAVTKARGCRNHAAKALGVTLNRLRRRINQIGAASMPPPWIGGQPPRSSVQLTADDFQSSQQRVVSPTLINGIHATLDLGMTPDELLERFPSLVQSIVNDRTPDDAEWTPAKLAARQFSLQKAFPA